MGESQMTARFAEQVTPSETIVTGPSSSKILAGPFDQLAAAEALMRSFSLVDPARAGVTQATKMERPIRIQPRPVLVQRTIRLLPDAANTSGKSGGRHYRNGG